MSVISTFSKNISSTESVFNFATTMGTSLFAARFIPVSMKECGIISATTGAISTFGHTFLNKNTSDFQKCIVIIGALALTYFGVTSLVPKINSRLAIALTPESVLKILAFNALGQVISFVLVKIFSKTPWNMSESEIQILHKTYTKNPELYNQLSSILKLLVRSRFCKLKLDVDPFLQEIPSKEAIESLTDDEARIFHRYEVYFDEKEGALNALLHHYFELNLPPFKDIEKDIPHIPLKMPKDVEEVKNLSNEKLTWYKHFFAQNDQARQALPFAVQWALYEKGSLETYSIDAAYLKVAPNAQIQNLMKPVLLMQELIKLLRSTPLAQGLMLSILRPWWEGFDAEVQMALIERAQDLNLTTPFSVYLKVEDIARLSEEAIRAYHQQMPTYLTKEAAAALNRHFYELKLPLPNGIVTVQQWINKKLPSPDINIPLATHISEVQQLDDNQLPWVYFAYTKSKWNNLCFEVQSALNDRFNVTQGCCHLFTFCQLTSEKVEAASEESIKILHSQLKKRLMEWVKLPPDVRQILNTRFKNISEDPISLDAIEICTLSKSNIKAYHAIFTKQLESWNAFTKAQQRSFNAAFEQEGLETFLMKWI